MEIVSFSVSKYRSITKAYKLPIRRPTILIGPNNEGKSNVLGALVASLQFLSSLGGVTLRKHRITSQMRSPEVYDWSRDFPLALQNKQPEGESIFDLELKLTNEEIAAFKKEVKSNLNGTLPIQLRFGVADTKLNVAKPGKGGATLTSKAQLIARFVARHIHLSYIPAVRTASAATQIVTDLVDRELSMIERQPEYKAALHAVAKLQEPVLAQISESLKSTLRDFLPNVTSVTVEIPESYRYRALRRNCEIIIDDGTPTTIDRKGDGVQSLAALSLMRYVAHSGSSSRQLILAIEEPESHLHPNAIHQLKGVIDDLSNQHQIILTTHCPLFVDRTNLKSNIIVNNRKAMPASSIKEVREILGVRASDNLRNAELVLLVEGEEDRRSLRALLPASSKVLKSALESGTLAIDTLQGGTNLSYKIGQLRDSLCIYHSVLDRDKCGTMAYDKAETEGLITVADVTFITCPGLEESEFEDIIDQSLYLDYIRNKFGVSLMGRHFKSKKKWSDRARLTFTSQGKNWTKSLESELKRNVSELIEKNPTRGVDQHKRGAYDALVATLETKLKSLKDRS